MGPTEKLAQFVVDTRFGDIPSEAIRLAKRLWIDTMATTLAGSADPVGRIIAKYVQDIGGTAECGIVGAGFKTSAPSAALANGTMAHALDYDDVGMSSGHPSVTVFPVLLALGEKLKLSGKEILEAHIMGFEVEGKIAWGTSRVPYARGWHGTSIFGTLGAAAAAAKMLKLDVEGTRMALGIAASHAGGLRQNFGTMTKPLHAGSSCRAGVMAAMLAKEGFTSDAGILENQFGYANVVLGKGEYNLEKMVNSLGNPYHIMSPGVGIKKYPACYGNHRAIDTLLEMVQEYDIKPEDVESVTAEVNPFIELVLIHHDPQTGFEGKFSLEYNLAATVLDRKLPLSTYTDQKARDPKLREMMKKVKMVVHPDWAGGATEGSLPITVRLKNGKEYKHELQVIRGAPELPLTREELLTKFQDCAQQIQLSQKQIDRCIELIDNLENLQNICELMDIVVAGAKVAA